MEISKKIIVVFLFLCGCHSPRAVSTLPLPSTTPVKESLEEVKTQIEQAGAQNTKIAEHVTDALTLAEELDKLLEKIEKEQEKMP